MAIQTEDQLAGQIILTVDNVTFLSGAPLVQIVDNARIRVENYTGISIGSTAIAEKYQPAILDFSRAEAMRYISIQGGDFGTITLGPFSMRKGQPSNITDAAIKFDEMGMQKLKELGRQMNFVRVTGG